MSLTQFVVIRGDLISKLNWPVGSVIAQGCHASVAALFAFKDDPNVAEYTKTLESMTKVVLEIKNEGQLVKLTEQLDEARIDYRKWIEQPENMLTAIATKPYLKDEVREHFKKCQLFRPTESTSADLSESGPPQNKKRKLNGDAKETVTQSKENNPQPADDACEESEEASLGPLETIDEVKAAFAEFIARVPADLVPGLHKLVREREAEIQEGSPDDQDVETSDAAPSRSAVGLHGHELLAAIITELRQRLSVSAEAPGEEIIFNRSAGYENYAKENTVSVDAFLYDDDDIDELEEQGLVKRNYCTDCHSRNILPLNFVSHSNSVTELHFLLTECLGDKLNGKVFVDLGSRTGAALYSGYTFSKAKRLIGLQRNKFFCDVQVEMVKKFKMGDRIEIICSDMLEQGELLKTADVVYAFNTFEFFAKTEEQAKFWKFLMATLRAGAILLVSPSLEQQFVSGKVPYDASKWVKKIPIRIPKAKYTEEEIEGLREFHLYQVLREC